MVCARRTFYTQTPLHTGAFTQKTFYTQKFLLTDALHKDAFAHIKAHRRFYTQNLLHRDTFAQNNSFYTKNKLHKQILTHKNLYTQTWTAHFFTLKLLHAETLPRTVFVQIFPYGNLYAHFFYAQQFLHRCLELHTDAFTRAH